MEEVSMRRHFLFLPAHVTDFGLSNLQIYYRHLEFRFKTCSVEIWFT